MMNQEKRCRVNDAFGVRVYREHQVLLGMKVGNM